MKTFTKLSTVSCLAILTIAGCKSTRPGTDDSMTGGTNSDYTSMSELPDRGDFNPDTDVDYAVFQQGGSDTGIIYFPTDQSTVQTSQRPKLEKIANWMKENTSKSILIAGHCDDRGTLEYNRALGERRAIAVRDYLIGLGVGGERIYTHSYGEEKPAVAGSGESAWSKNRRAEIGVVAK